MLGQCRSSFIASFLEKSLGQLSRISLGTIVTSRSSAQYKSALLILAMLIAIMPIAALLLYLRCLSRQQHTAAKACAEIRQACLRACTLGALSLPLNQSVTLLQRQCRRYSLAQYIMLFRLYQGFPRNRSLSKLRIIQAQICLRQPAASSIRVTTLHASAAQVYLEQPRRGCFLISTNSR